MNVSHTGETFLVIGAGGNVGSEVTRALQAKGHLVRSPLRAGGRPLPSGVAALPGDLSNEEHQRLALDGVTGIFLIAGLPSTPDLLAAAAARGVSRVVLLSTAATEVSANQDALTRFHRRSEDAVTASSLQWTLLRPQAFASNVLRWLPELAIGDDIRLAFPDLPAALIDPMDIGEVAAKTLLETGHDGRAYRLSGPRALLPAEQVEIVARKVGRPLHPVPLDDAAARELLLKTAPPAIVDAFFTLYRHGGLDESLVTHDVASVLGRPPNTFGHWVRRHREQLQPRRS